MPEWTITKRILVAIIFIFAMVVLFALVDDADAQEFPQAPSATRTVDAPFVAATAITLGLGALDAWSTCRNLDHGYREQNVILGSRPAKWNVWMLTIGEPVVWSTVAYFVKRATGRSNNRVIRNSWLPFHILSASGHGYGAIHNMAIYDPVKYPRVR